MRISFVFILSFYPYGIASGGMVISGAILLWSSGIAGDRREMVLFWGYGIHGTPMVMLWLDTKISTSNG